MFKECRIECGESVTGAHVELPLPPSVNACWRNVRGVGRVRTSAYRSWIDAAGWELRSQRPSHVPGEVSISIRAARPNRRRDLDNTIKPILDLLSSHRTIEDDARVTALAAIWDPTVEAGRVRVSVRQAGGAA